MLQTKALHFLGIELYNQGAFRGDDDMEVSIDRIHKDLEVEYLDYNLIFLGAPVYENLSPKVVLNFLHRNRRRKGVELLASAPETPGVAAVPFCTYGGGHNGYCLWENSICKLADFMSNLVMRDKWMNTYSL